MNYFGTYSEFLDSVLELLDNGFDNPKRVDIAISYSQGNRVSIITMQVSPTAIVHSLTFYYDSALNLFDCVGYKNKTIFRVGQESEAFQFVGKVNCYLLENSLKRSLYAEEQTKEVGHDAERIKSKIQEIQHLKDRLRIEAGKNQSMRNQIKVFKKR